MGTSCASLCHGDDIEQWGGLKEQRFWHEKMHFSKASQALFNASVSGDLSVAKDALRKLGDPKCCTRQGLRPLQVAIAGNNAELVDLLLSANCDVNDFMKNTPPPIILAAGSGDVMIFRRLLAMRADLTITDNISGETALIRAADCGHIELVQLILEQNSAGHKQLLAQMPRVGPQGDHSTALHVAARHGFCAICDCLLGVGSDPNATDWEGRTPLHIATCGNHVPVVSLLLPFGVNVSARDRNSDMAIHLAAEQGLLPIAERLLQCKAHVNACRPHSTTPLHVAANGGHVAVCQLLLRHKADPNAANDAGETPFIIAFSKAHVNACRILMEFGASLPAMDSPQWTPPVTAFDPHEYVKLRRGKASHDDDRDFAHVFGC